MPNANQQITINIDRLSPKARELETQIAEEKKRWLWFDHLCVDSKMLSKREKKQQICP